MRNLFYHKWTFVFVFLASLAFGCAGGIPSVPNKPDDVLKKARYYFDKHKYLQARELYKAFLSKYPGHDKSDEAQFYVAECYFYDNEYPLAAVEYRILMNNYGYSEYVDDALFKIGVCSFKQAPRAELDQSKSFEALSLFDQFLRTFPNSPLSAKAHEYINRIYKKLAKKDFENGYFYFRHKRMRPASIYFKKVIEKYPGNEHWVKALYYQARILIANGEKDKAKKLLERALEYPKDIEVKKKAAEALKMLGG